MAIGKVNAYATVDAPKADFGAVAQLNIDNLVKSAKEDEQLKATKKAAEAKAKQEAAKEFGDFKVLDATGFNLQDQYSAQETKKLLDEFVMYKNLYIETRDPKYSTKRDSILAYINSVNSNSAILKEDISNFSKLAGEDSIAPKFKDRGMNLVNLLGDGNTVFSRGEDGNGKVALYDTLEDGKTRKLKETLDYRDYLSLIKNAPKKVVFQDEFTKDKGLFEKNLTETQVTSLKKTGIEKISPDTEAAMLKYAMSKMNDDSFMAAWGDESGVIDKDDYRVKGFTEEERTKAAKLYADKLKTFYGIKSTVDVKQAPTPAKGDGGGKAIKGQANVAIDSPFKLIKPNEIRGYTTGANDVNKMASVPVGSLSYPINASGMDKPEMMDSSTGGKTGAIITPNSFYVSPDGNLYLTASSKSSEQIRAEGGVYSGAENVEGNNYVFSYRTNGTEFANAAKGILNTQPTWKLPNGKQVDIRTTKDIVNYFDQLDKLRGGKGLSLRTVKVGTPSSNTAKTNNKQVIKGF